VKILMTRDEIDDALQDRLENQGFSTREFDFQYKYVNRGKKGSGHYGLVAEITITKKAPEENVTKPDNLDLDVLDLGDD